MGKIWHEHSKFPGDLLEALVIPCLTTILTALLFGWQQIIITISSAIASGMIAAFYIFSLLKGHTGDTYGAVIEISETCSLVIIAIAIQVLAL